MSDTMESILYFIPVVLFSPFNRGLFQGCYPKIYSVVQVIGNWTMMGVLFGVLVGPIICIVMKVDPIWVVILYIPIICLLGKYAPWYITVGFPVFIFLWTAVTAGWSSMMYDKLATFDPTQFACWCWCFCLYPIGRGFYHIAEWEKDRKACLPNHHTTEHPYILGLVAAGELVGTHYAFKSDHK